MNTWLVIYWTIKWTRMARCVDEYAGMVIAKMTILGRDLPTSNMWANFISIV